MRKPQNFDVLKQQRGRIVFERRIQPESPPTGDPKISWCQMAMGNSELGNYGNLSPGDCKRLCQTMFPYLASGQGLRCKPIQWLGMNSYVVEFSAVAANRRVFCRSTFTDRGGMLYWASMVTANEEQGVWRPQYEAWLTTATLSN